MWCTVSKTLLTVLIIWNCSLFSPRYTESLDIWVSLYASVVICECWIRILETSKIQGCRYMNIYTWEPAVVKGFKETPRIYLVKHFYFAPNAFQSILCRLEVDLDTNFSVQLHVVLELDSLEVETIAARQKYSCAETPDWISCRLKRSPTKPGNVENTGFLARDGGPTLWKWC